MSTPELTTTSYAILGLLALRSWTTYELAQQMERALGMFWPRARSKLYEEPKKLVVAGLAKAATEHVGRRPRTVYTITAKGRRVLAAWTPTPGAGPVLEYEQLVKVFFAEHGTKQDLLATIDSARAWIEERAAETEQIPYEYLEGRGAYPERLPWLIITGRFLDEIDRAVCRWADWATTEVESWPEDISKAQPDWTTLEDMASYTSELAARARARTPQEP
ncbi:MAG TPA: PadR family transcriptional regulator [Mycobacteriales bacterium]|nr:PadR family transcriptional regulator [Mycobacteriales bacterium]